MAVEARAEGVSNRKKQAQRNSPRCFNNHSISKAQVNDGPYSTMANTKRSQRKRISHTPTLSPCVQKRN